MLLLRTVDMYMVKFIDQDKNLTTKTMTGGADHMDIFRKVREGTCYLSHNFLILGNLR